MNVTVASEPMPVPLRRRDTEWATNDSEAPGCAHFAPDVVAKYYTAPLPELPRAQIYAPDSASTPSDGRVTDQREFHLKENVGPRFTQQVIAQSSAHHFVSPRVELPPVAPLNIRKRSLEGPREPVSRTIPVPRERQSGFRKFKNYIERQKALFLNPTESYQDETCPTQFYNKPKQRQEGTFGRSPLEIIEHLRMALEQRRIQRTRPRKLPDRLQSYATNYIVYDHRQESYMDWPVENDGKLPCETCKQPLIDDVVAEGETFHVRVLPDEPDDNSADVLDDPHWPIA